MKTILLITAMVLTVVATASAQIVLQKAVISQAGGTATNGTTTLQYTVSQPVVGTAVNTQMIGQFGFWSVQNGVAAGIHNTVAASAINALTVFPNPAQGQVKIELVTAATGSVDLGLYDDGGRFITSIYSGNASIGTTNYRFDVSGLASGTYFIAASMPGSLVQTKLSVVK
ncbi:MAG TPA: T9SS type A sorting domain-containing protein [Candidatus Kapabacteria bacterium]|nr:T9SS type A sorting domain-containing protein [Candidatus Kapabacteria bacterium]